MKKKQILNIVIILTVIIISTNYMTTYSLASTHARHEQTPEQAEHTFDNMPKGLGWYDFAKWCEANDMYCYWDSDIFTFCGNGVWGEGSGNSFVYYATPGEPTWEAGVNIFGETIKKSTMPVYDKGVIVDPNNRKVEASVDSNYIQQNEFSNQIVLNNVVSTMEYNSELLYDANFDAYYNGNESITQNIPCFEITADKPCLVEIQQSTVRTDGKSELLQNTVLFCPTDLNNCISAHYEYKSGIDTSRGVLWDLVVATNDYYNESSNNYHNTTFSLENPEEAAAGVQKLGAATTHFTLAQGKNYIYYNSYCDTVNNFIISTTDGSASIKLDCVVRYATKTSL